MRRGLTDQRRAVRAATSAGQQDRRRPPGQRRRAPGPPRRPARGARARPPGRPPIEHRPDADDDAQRPAVPQHQRGQQPGGGRVVGGEAVVGRVREQRGRDGSCTNGRGSTCSAPAIQMASPQHARGPARPPRPAAACRPGRGRARSARRAAPARTAGTAPPATISVFTRPPSPVRLTPPRRRRHRPRAPARAGQHAPAPRRGGARRRAGPAGAGAGQQRLPEQRPRQQDADGGFEHRGHRQGLDERPGGERRLGQRRSPRAATTASSTAVPAAAHDGSGTPSNCLSSSPVTPKQVPAAAPRTSAAVRPPGPAGPHTATPPTTRAATVTTASPPGRRRPRPAVGRAESRNAGQARPRRRGRRTRAAARPRAARGAAGRPRRRARARTPARRRAAAARAPPDRCAARRHAARTPRPPAAWAAEPGRPAGQAHQPPAALATAVSVAVRCCTTVETANAHAPASASRTAVSTAAPRWSASVRTSRSRARTCAASRGSAATVDRQEPGRLVQSESCSSTVPPSRRVRMTSADDLDRAARRASPCPTPSTAPGSSPRSRAAQSVPALRMP